MTRVWLKQSPSRNLMRAAVLAVGMFAGAATVAACADDTPSGIGGATNIHGDGGVAACTEGSTKSCYVTIGEHNGVLSCYEGTRTCENGVWTECLDGEVTNKLGASLQGSLTKPLALNPPSSCDNPCDPTCMTFEEDPDAELSSSTAEGGVDWLSGGSIANLPPGLVNKGIIEPCEWGGDCQFNSYCDKVVTDDACPHSKCSTGAAFSGACVEDDKCVEAICDTDPDCCQVACTHDPCVTGVKLSKSCDSCVTSVCDARPECCSGSWTAECVDLIATACPTRTCTCSGSDVSYGGSCYRYVDTSAKWTTAQSSCRAIGPGWDLTTISDWDENEFVYWNVPATYLWIGLNDDATEGTHVWSDLDPSSYRYWWPGEPDGDGDCVDFDGYSTATWDDYPCTVKEPYMCEGPGTVLSTSASPRTWSQSCVDKVGTVCDARCGAGTPPAEVGTCVPWLPGQKDPTCAGVDLAVAVPCDGIVPVCNHGNTVAPAGVPLVWYPGNSAHYGECNETVKDIQGTCYTEEEIPPGACISVACNIFGQGMGNQKEIYINPASVDGVPLAGHIPDECSCVDNWAEGEKGAVCSVPECSGAVEEANIKPVNMYFIIDKSGSMGSCTGASKWTAAVQALKAFFGSSDSAGFHIAMEFFLLDPDTPSSMPAHDGCGMYNACEYDKCANPVVPLGTLTADPRPTDTLEADLFQWLNAVCPGGNTPTEPALGGALQWCVAHQNANPSEEHVVILVTDGEPTRCNLDDNFIANLARDAFQDYGIRTYPIGMQGADYGALDLIAQRGGTDEAIRIDSSDPAATEQMLLDALRAIAGEAVSCTMDLPSPGTFNPYDAQVVYSPSVGQDVNWFQASSEAACDATHQWYYDDNNNPTTLSLCEDQCTIAQDDPGARIEIHLGCPTTFEPATYVQLYAPTCPPGTRVQWGYLSYSTVTPLDSTVVFEARTANTEAELTGDYTQLATAQADPDTQSCPMTGVTGCPVDLYDKLGLPDAMMPVLELSVTMSPSTNAMAAPSLSDWNITYSCPPTE